MTIQTAPTSRSSDFGYICRRCSLCCRHQRIQLNPYEVARLARAKGQSTAEFGAAWTLDGLGTVLAQKEDGTCVFLGPQGCQVHPDRPLVCRLYPLGRHVLTDGSESFVVLEGHPQSQGEFINRGTVADHLAAQGAQPFIDAADAYFRWLFHAQKQLGLNADDLNAAPDKAAAHSDLVDMDGTIATHCAVTGEAEPVNLDDRLHLHLHLLYDAIAQREDEHVEEPAQGDSAAYA